MPYVVETVFTPLQSAAGGALIGLAAVLLMAYAGRVFGATGLVAGAFFPNGANDRTWRLALIAGMISGPMAVMLITGRMPDLLPVASLPVTAIGGLIVGVGVTLGAGCTSGHGVCGLARRSPRSLAATLTFMLSTAITVFVLRHVIGGF